MIIVSDENIPGVESMFGDYGDLRFIPGRSITKMDLLNADVLLVRTLCEVNRQLVEGTPVKFVGSMTSGTDHIDTNYLSSRDIEFAHAPGCNAMAVVQYDFSVFASLRPDWKELQIGILGCGNVGLSLYKILKRIGAKVRVFDPFLTNHDVSELVEFSEVLKSDILCIHTPLTYDGSHPTAKLLNHSQISTIRSGTLLINAGRGGVIDNAALLNRLIGQNDLLVALDVWEGEPDINLSLFSQVSLATPHIAGYTWEAKMRATGMVRNAFLSWSGISCPSADIFEKSEGHLDSIVDESTLNDAILACYDVASDDKVFRNKVTSSLAVGVTFDSIRNTYPARHEFNYYSVDAGHKLAEDLSKLGFSMANYNQALNRDR